MKVYETLNTPEKILKFKEAPCSEFIGSQICPTGDCTKCNPLIDYLNSEVPKSPLEEIGAELKEVTHISGYEKWEIETENNGTVYITVCPRLKSFDVIGAGTADIAKAITDYLETLK